MAFRLWILTIVQDVEFIEYGLHVPVRRGGVLLSFDYWMQQQQCFEGNWNNIELPNMHPKMNLQLFTIKSLRGTFGVDVVECVGGVFGRF